MTDLPLTKVAETATTVTLSWTPVPCLGYVLYADGKRKSNSWDAAKSSWKTDKAAEIRIVALGAVAEGVFPAVVVPPVPAVWPHGGRGIWRTGDALPPGSDRYDVVIVAGWQADKASALPATTKALLYTSDVSCDMRQSGADYFYGVSGPAAIANGWALKDTSGNIVHNSGYANSVLADPSLVAFQNAWATNVIAFCKSHGMDGVQIDDVDGVRKHYFTETVAKFPTDQSWQDAHASFHAFVIPKLRAAGLFVVSNTAGPLSFLTRIARLTDSVMLEAYKGEADTVKAVNAGGAIAMPLSFSNPDQYRTSFQKADRGDGVFLYEPPGGADPWGTWCNL